MNSFKPQMQQLEAREVPASFSLTGSTLTITANPNGGSLVEITGTSSNLSVLWVDMNGSASGTYSAPSPVTAIVFNGSSSGTDEYLNFTTVSDTVNGSGSAYDIFYGGYGATSVINASSTGTNVIVTNAMNSTVNLGTGYAMALNYGGQMSVTNDPPGDYIWN